MRYVAMMSMVLGAAFSIQAQDLAIVEREVTAFERGRAAAIAKGDSKVWAEHIADDCIWVNLSTGEVVQNKAERIATISERGSRPASTVAAEKFHVEANRVLHTGQSSAVGRFARVYAKRDGGWQMIALYVEKFP